MERIHLLSVEDQPTKALLAQTCVGVFFIHSVSDTIFCDAIYSKTACGPHFTKHWSRGMLL
jgi:hypothetical protein